MLDNGPSPDAMRAYNDTVVCLLSDLGTEVMLGSSPDIVDLVIKGIDPDIEDPKAWIAEHYGDTRMYPLALTVPGVGHLMDWVTAKTLWRLPLPSADIKLLGL